MSSHCRVFQKHIFCFMLSQTGPLGEDSEKIKIVLNVIIGVSSMIREKSGEDRFTLRTEYIYLSN